MNASIIHTGLKRAHRGERTATPERNEEDSVTSRTRLRQGPVELRRGGGRQHRGRGDEGLVLERARHQGLEALARDEFRTVLLVRADTGVVHARAVEEVGLRGARQERRDRHPGVLEFIADGLGEGQQERLGGGVHGLERAGHRRGDGGGEQDAALASLHHVLHHALGEVDRGRDVETDEVEFRLEVRVSGEVTTHAHSGVDGDRGDGTARVLDALVELLHAFIPGEIHLHALHPATQAFEGLGCFDDARVLRDHQEVETILGELLRQLVANATGCPRDDRQGARLRRVTPSHGPILRRSRPLRRIQGWVASEAGQAARSGVLLAWRRLSGGPPSCPPSPLRNSGWTGGSPTRGRSTPPRTREAPPVRTSRRTWTRWRSARSGRAEITRGWLLGRRARRLIGTDWRPLMDRPLDEVRAMFGLDLERVDALLRESTPSSPPARMALA